MVRHSGTGDATYQLQHLMYGMLASHWGQPVAMDAMLSHEIAKVVDTLRANLDGCVGMAANMIGIYKRIIAFNNNGTYEVMMNPEIVTGISMMLLFVFVGGIIGAEEKLGFNTILIAHITFCLPYVILSVRPRVLSYNKSLTEAALDLGCTPVQAFFKVELPNIMPGIISGFIMAFTLSLDDFVISYFTQGPSFETLPIRIFSMTKKRVTPDMYALSTLIFVVILLLLVLLNVAQVRGEKKMNKKKFL